MTQDEFLKDVSDPDNHRVLLWAALEMGKECGSSGDVAEFGAGGGSTPYLRQYCKDENIEFHSFDSNKEWATIWGSIHISDWERGKCYAPYSVLLVDQAPGEYRHITIRNLKDYVGIIVVHDAEPDESMGYRLSEIWPLFKYRIFYKGKKIWSAAVSNSIDVNQLNNYITEYKLEL
jgi:hypothetical protein